MRLILLIISVKFLIQPRLTAYFLPLARSFTMSNQVENITNCYNQDRENIQITYDEKREQVYLLLNDKQISDDDFYKIMEQISEEENACYGELAFDFDEFCESR